MSFSVISAFLRKVHAGFDTLSSVEQGIWREILTQINAATVEGLMQSSAPSHSETFLSALRHSNEVFAAFKVHALQQEVAAKLLTPDGRLKSFAEFRRDVEGITSHQCGAWLQTEYDTAVIRAHNAADWQGFEANKDIMPNLRWLPTTAPDPDADHRGYWVARLNLPVDDPFWQHHHPGDHWNCKCSLEQNNDPVVRPSDIPAPDPQPGLDNNPGIDGHTFSDNHPYFPKSCGKCGFYKPTLKNRLKATFANRQKDCYNCPYINNCLDTLCKSDKPDKENIKSHRAEYKSLVNDPDYKDVVFDKHTGGLKATHIGHITHEGEHAQRFFGGLTSSDLENECQNQLFAMGHKTIFCNETKRENGKQLAALDMVMDDKTMDIRSVTGRGWYSNIFVKKNDQLRRYNNRHDVKKKADALCLYFHDPNLFDDTKMRKSIHHFKFYRKHDGNLLDKELKHIYCVIKGRNELLYYEI